jgi:hypothetical protein
MHKYSLDLVDWSQIANVAEMVESGRMKRADIEFGPLKVAIYAIPGQDTLRIDFRITD